MKVKGLVKKITKKDFEFSVPFFSKKMSGSVLELKTPEGEIMVDFPNYHPGIADKKFLIGSEIEYSHKSDSMGEGWKEEVYFEQYNLKVLTGKLKGEKFETSFTY